MIKVWKEGMSAEEAKDVAYYETAIARFKLKELRKLIPYLERCKEYLESNEGREK